MPRKSFWLMDDGVSSVEREMQKAAAEYDYLLKLLQSNLKSHPI